MWLIALKTLVADRGKLATALVGVVFSVVLVNVQGGLFLGLLGKVSLLVDFSQADIWVGHKLIHNVDFPQDIPRRWAYRLRTIPGVELADPYIIGYSNMTLPSGGFEGLVIVGCDRRSLLGNAWSIAEGNAGDVRRGESVIVDQFEDQKLESPALDGHRSRATPRVRETR